ncbi:MAG: hypothetical protein WCI22_17240 [Actinomycetota bacterium]
MDTSPRGTPPGVWVMAASAFLLPLALVFALLASSPELCGGDSCDAAGGEAGLVGWLAVFFGHLMARLGGGAAPSVVGGLVAFICVLPGLVLSVVGVVRDGGSEDRVAGAVGVGSIALAVVLLVAMS